MKKIKVATVFSGIGAIEFAFKRLGIEHEVVFACDNGNITVEYDYNKEIKHVRSLKTAVDKRDYVNKLYCDNTKRTNFVKKSYLENYDIVDDMFFNDVRLLDGKDFNDKVDLFVGGSPCQSFSSVGEQAGLEDTRGTLFYEYARLVKEIQPKVFIYENVRGLLNHDKGNTWKTIKKVFDTLGYNIKFKLLNSSDFGIPQTRRRLFVVGYKGDSEFDIPDKKCDLTFTMQDFTIEKCKFGNFTSSLDENDIGNIIAKRGKGVIDEKYFLSPLVKIYVLKGGTKTFYQKPETDLKVARTILASMGNKHRAGVDNYITVNGELRMLSEREAHRLMGFTDDYKIIVSKAQAYKQAGNSIVVDVLMEILKEIIDFKLLK